MTKFVPKNNNLIVSKNSFKKADNHPDFKGKITLIEPLPVGDYDVGLYVKIGNSGEYMNGTIKPAFSKDVPKKISAPVSSDDDFSDEIPF